MTSTRFTYTVVASPLHDREAVDGIVTPIAEVAGGLGGRRLAADDDGAPDQRSETAAVGPEQPHVIVVATGGTEQQILDLVARRRVSHADLPVVLVAHPAHNSLPASLEALAALQQSRRRGRIVYLAGDTATRAADDANEGASDDRSVLDDAIVDLEAILRLRTTRLGLVGGPSSWLVASSPDPDVVHRRWGPRVELIDPARMIELSRTPVVPVGPLADRFVAGAESSHGRSRPDVDRAAVEAAVQAGAALDDLVDVHELDAVTVRCFDLLGDPGTSGCLALARLNDGGIVAGCEGDLPSTLGMLWVRHLLGQASWMANPSRLDRTRNSLVLAHCTVAPSLTDGYSLSTHFESGIGVGVSGHFADQPVTLLRVGGRDLEQCWIAEGAIVGSGDEPDLCRTQVTVELSGGPVGGSVDDLLDRPLGNHLVMAAGHHGDRLRRWWQLAIAD